ncbi:guanine nucleotide exchange factor MSS4 homolog [Fopius arisanus]|uniref:Guanine nucleotide exchange factor MSS4 homolog n=1 Tax=Fopius arisanus TaxID=64838 RepID=A0A9R1TBP1_9HYME|nr:PREDICTED: guanine nucleotide exchange factor MSS4 homolog [Fopius arisanus]
MSSTVESNYKDKCDGSGKNKSKIYCQFCPSVILNPGMGTFLVHEFDLPHVRSKGDEGVESQLAKYTDYWLIEDMYTFENVSITKTVGNIKYLACADCEIGPIGYMDQSTKKCYVALSRVTYTHKCP